VDACPRGAWLLDDSLLGLDPQACDACGQCAPACPEGAIEVLARPASYPVGGQVVAFAACARAAGASPDAGVVPCLHGLGLWQLLDLYRGGARVLCVADTDCDGCERGGSQRLADALREVQELLRDRGLEPLRVRRLDPASWRGLRQAAVAVAAARGLDRRAFLRQVRERARRALATDAATEDGGADAFVPPARLLPESVGERLYPHVPSIDPLRCTGCDACARVCPHGAIGLAASAPGGDAYRLEPRSCTGCGLCGDVCAVDAVGVGRLEVSRERLIPLRTRRCRACGAPFHYPAVAAARRDLCPVCAHSRRHRELFQVLG
jgi:ferredoxin